MNNMTKPIANIRNVLLFCAFALMISANCFAENIKDNSFLIEEAYNQEAGVAQHINTFQYMPTSKDWNYSLTSEWSAPNQYHQASFTLPVMKSDSTALGDMALNYRYQAMDKNGLALSPRFSLLLPTGTKGNSSNNLGYQINMPVSWETTQAITTHYNLGFTFIPGGADLQVINYGTSAIWNTTETFNLMLEFTGYLFSKSKTNLMYINPGFRYAYNASKDFQIVPGVGFPMGLGAAAGDRSVFGYLSFEHGVW
jgi:hypothetical protein